jgi:hypothetical protein
MQSPPRSGTPGRRFDQKRVPDRLSSARPSIEPDKHVLDKPRDSSSRNIRQMKKCYVSKKGRGRDKNACLGLAHGLDEDLTTNATTANGPHRHTCTKK